VELIFFVCLGQVLSMQSPPPRPYFLWLVSSFPCEASPVSVQIDLAVGARFLLGLRGRFSRGQDFVFALARFLGLVFCCRCRSERAAISQSVFRLSVARSLMPPALFPLPELRFQAGSSPFCSQDFLCFWFLMRGNGSGVRNFGFCAPVLVWL
jgi:hypothetical protein